MATSKETRKPAIPTWRYKIHYFERKVGEGGPVNQLEQELNEMGQAGWEVFAIDRVGSQLIFFLKASGDVIRTIPAPAFPSLPPAWGGPKERGARARHGMA